ncbi:MAG: klhl18 [Myxococcales bacterium]|nr:klhl18 [Myxococcales bacterium]
MSLRSGITLAALVVALALAGAGCFSGNPADDVYACGTPPDECPSGYYCAGNGRCRQGASPSDSCANATQDGDETATDCGGHCPPCDVGQGCVADGDCQTASCPDARCALATGPPFWRPRPVMIFERRKPTVIATPDGRLFAIGGGDRMNALSNSVEVYDVQAGKWSGFAPTVLARSAGAGALLDGRLYVAGGFGNEKQLEAYDFTQAAWAVKQNDIGFQIDDAGFAAAGGALFVFGGLDPPTAVTANAYSLQPATGWQSLAKLQPRRALAGAVGADDRIYAVGGHDGARAVDTVQAYSRVTAQWSDATPLPAATEGLAAAAGSDGRIYVVGGAVAGAPVASVWAYTPASGRWNAVAPLQAPRTGLAAAVASDGIVYAIGGASAGVTALRDVEAYGPAVTLAPAAPTAGGEIVATGINFAAGAEVRVYAGGAATGTPIATGKSDAAGALAPLTLPPFGAAGSYTLTFVDGRSRYPVAVAVTVAP